ncbi:hypothetical protein KCP73_11560 [Salmonella enterica subsp. enterica]|nr:hypothetical protein KCP73_11560 [Salmonella enterica subsp. enterica]
MWLFVVNHSDCRGDRNGCAAGFSRPSWREAEPPYPPETPSEGVSITGTANRLGSGPDPVKYNYSGPRYTRTQPRWSFRRSR